MSIISAMFHNNNNVTSNKSCKLKLSTHNNNKLWSSEAGEIVYSISQRSVVFSNQEVVIYVHLLVRIGYLIHPADASHGRICTQHGIFLMPKLSSWDGPLMFDRGFCFIV